MYNVGIVEQALDETRLKRAALELAEKYDGAHKRVQIAIADSKAIRERLIPILRRLKAVLVGRGREGEWGPFCENKPPLGLGMSVRTVDNWLLKDSREHGEEDKDPEEGSNLLASEDKAPATV